MLGVSRNASFPTIQKAFRKLALQHHPDVSTNKRGSQEHFVAIRQAFEWIRKTVFRNQKIPDDSDGFQTNRTKYDDDGNKSTEYWLQFTEEDFLECFFQQTGQRLSSAQRRELVQLHRSRIPGAKYDGPAWALAERLVQMQDIFLTRAAQGQDNPSWKNHTTTSSESSDPESSSVRRKRRR